MSKIDIIGIVIVCVVFLGVVFGLIMNDSIKLENNLIHCNSFYICEKGKIDYKDGQCVCSNVFPISRK